MSVFLCCFRKQPGEVHGEEGELEGEARQAGLGEVALCERARPGGAIEGTEVLRDGEGIRIYLQRQASNVGLKGSWSNVGLKGSPPAGHQELWTTVLHLPQSGAGLEVSPADRQVCQKSCVTPASRLSLDLADSPTADCSTGLDVSGTSLQTSLLCPSPPSSPRSSPRALPLSSLLETALCHCRGKTTPKPGGMTEVVDSVVLARQLNVTQELKELLGGVAETRFLSPAPSVNLETTASSIISKLNHSQRAPAKSPSRSPSLYQKLADRHLCTNTYSTAARRKPVDLGPALSLPDLANNCQDHQDISENTSKSLNPVYQPLEARCMSTEDAASLEASLKKPMSSSETIPKVSESSSQDSTRLCQTFDYTSPPRHEDNETTDISQLLPQPSSPPPRHAEGSSLAPPSPPRPVSSPLSYSPLVVQPSSCCSSSPSTPTLPSPTP